MYRLTFVLAASLLLCIKIFPQDGVVNSFYPSDTLKSRINYVNKVREGEAKFYFPNGKIKEELTYENGKVNGLVKLYSETGKLKETFNVEEGRREGPTSLFDSTGQYIKDINFENGKLVPEVSPIEEARSKTLAAVNDNKTTKKDISNKKISELKKKTVDMSSPPSNEEEKMNDDPAYYLTAEVMPEPVGGLKAIMDKIIYPYQAKKDKIQGVVKIKTFIDEYGDVTNAEVVQGIGHGCDEAARTAVFYARFKPGLVKGKPVKVQMIIPIDFKLDKK
jgi:protein TonB